MYKPRMALIAFAFAGTFLGTASAHAGASTGTWKYSPQQIDRYQSRQQGYYEPRQHGYEQAPRYYEQRRGYERHDRGNHYGWNRQRSNEWDQPYYR